MRPSVVLIALVSLAAAASESARARESATAQTVAPPATTARQDPPRGVLPPQPGTSARPVAPPAQPAPQRASPAQPQVAPPAQPQGAAPAPARPAAAAPATPQAPAPGEPTPSEAVLGAPIYPGATFLGSFSAGQGQRYYLFGTSAAYTQVVQFYRTALKSRGDEIYDVPPVWSFDTGRFREETMAYPPSVVVRDHVAGGRKGYLHVSGTQSQRYPTVIQIVPPALGERR
jgi:hypothetical protein